MSDETLLNDQIAAWFNARWTPAMGAIDGHDLRFMASLLAEAKPKTVVEIGCASGLSTSVLAMMLDQIGPAAITSFDLGTQFYADPSKAVGYLTKEIPVLPRTEIEIVTGRACLAVPDRFEAESVDFCFIDAAHQHPWPLIDTLVMLPLLKPGGFIVHHDPIMAWSAQLHATGPKLLQLLLPEDIGISFESRVLGQTASPLKTRTKSGNIFALCRPADIQGFASRMAQGFLLGWDTAFAPYRNNRIGDDFSRRLSKYLTKTYAPDVAEAFAVGLKRYNAAVPFSSGTIVGPDKL